MLNTAPNGATYQACGPDRIFGKNSYEWSVLVTHPDHDPRRICGWNGAAFASKAEAEAWAIVDGRYEYTPGKTLPERKMVSLDDNR